MTQGLDVKRWGTPTAGQSSPDVSVIVPVRNEAKYIGRCLDSILSQQIDPLSMEILVVDDRSIDRTRELVAEVAQRDCRVRVLDNPHDGVSSALNIGIEAARGRYITRMDAHADYDPDYIRANVNVLECSGATAVGGRAVPIPGADTAMAKSIAAVQETRFGMGGGHHRRSDYEGPAKSLWGGTFRREVVARVGGFDEALFRSEDNDFYQRVREAGGTLWISSSIHARYICRPTLLGFMAQGFVNGSEIVPTLRRNPRAMSPRHFAPSMAFLGLIALALRSLGPDPRPARRLLSLGTLLYGTLLVGSSIQVLRGAGRGTLLPTLIVFPAIHASYAIGTLAGLAKIASVARRARPPADRTV